MSGPTRILVTGATGLIGCHALRALVESGRRVRAFARDAGRVERILAPFGLPAELVDVATGDIANEDAVARALSGCDAVLHCAGLFSPRQADAVELERVNVTGTRVVVTQALSADVRRIVYVSSMVALFPPRSNRIRADDPVAHPRARYARTKAAAERFVRARQDEGAPIVSIYPAATQGPDDPTLSTGPQLVINAIRDHSTLVTRGGLAYTDVRDLARVVAALFSTETPPVRLMAPSFFVEHAEYHALLNELTGERIRARRVPAWLLRLLGRLGDLSQRFGRDAILTREAADILTRSVPVDDRVARDLLARSAISAEASFRDLIDWLEQCGEIRLSRTSGREGVTE